MCYNKDIDYCLETEKGVIFMVSKEIIDEFVELVDSVRSTEARDKLNKLNKIEQNEVLDRVLQEAYYGLGFYLDIKGKFLKDYSPLVAEQLRSISAAAQMQRTVAARFEPFFVANIDFAA